MPFSNGDTIIAADYPLDIGVPLVAPRYGLGVLDSPTTAGVRGHATRSSSTHLGLPVWDTFRNVSKVLCSLKIEETWQLLTPGGIECTGLASITITDLEYLRLAVQTMGPEHSLPYHIAATVERFLAIPRVRDVRVSMRSGGRRAMLRVTISMPEFDSRLMGRLADLELEADELAEKYGATFDYVFVPVETEEVAAAANQSDHPDGAMTD